MDARRLAYLDAMEIDVWVPRGSQLAESPRDEVADIGGPLLVLGDGDGDILCVAGSAREAHLRLATDIGGAMREMPVWSWPRSAKEDAALSMSVDDAVADRLFTRVLVFGEDLSETLFDGLAPDSVGTARVHVVPGLDQLANDRAAKRILWALMLEHGIADKPGQGGDG